MGVYIPKMEMPRNCTFCPCARMNVSRNGAECAAVDFYAENLMPQKGRMECCPLVEVKPHGRLIDADALMEKAFRYNIHGKLTLKVVFASALRDAPTIIEAETCNKLQDSCNKAENDPVNASIESEKENDKA